MTHLDFEALNFSVTKSHINAPLGSWKVANLSDYNKLESSYDR